MPANCNCWDVVSVTVCAHYSCVRAGAVWWTLLCMRVTLYVWSNYPSLCGLPFINYSFLPSLFWSVGALALLGKRHFAAKLTFTGVCPPPVILSTPSLCGAQPSKTSDRQANGSGGLQQHNTLSLPSLWPVARFNAHTYTHKRRKAIFCNPDFLFALW